MVLQGFSPASRLFSPLGPCQFWSINAESPALCLGAGTFPVLLQLWQAPQSAPFGTPADGPYTAVPDRQTLISDEENASDRKNTFRRAIPVRSYILEEATGQEICFLVIKNCFQQPSLDRKAAC